MLDVTKEVPLVDLCERLKKLGYPQENGLFYWVKYGDKWKLMPKATQSNISELSDDGIVAFYYPGWWNEGLPVEYVYRKNSNEYIKAPTCAELGEIIKPFGLPFWNRETEEWRWAFNLYLRVVTKGSEADARAMEAIWLAENGELRF